MSCFDQRPGLLIKTVLKHENFIRMSESEVDNYYEQFSSSIIANKFKCKLSSGDPWQCVNLHVRQRVKF